FTACTAPLNLPALGRSQPLYIHTCRVGRDRCFWYTVAWACSLRPPPAPRACRFTVPGRPFSRSYGANLPSSLTEVLPSTLVCSTTPPVSVCGTVARRPG